VIPGRGNITDSLDEVGVDISCVAGVLNYTANMVCSMFEVKPLKCAR